MARNFNKPGYLLIFIAVFIFCFNACRTNYSDDPQVLFQDAKPLLTQWNELFDDDEIISFTFNTPDTELITLGGMEICSNGNYIILDGKVRKVIQFNKEGKFIRTIGSIGEGPGEYYIPRRLFLDKENNLYVYDVAKHRVNKYVYPNYEFQKTFSMLHTPQSIIMDKAGNFIIYAVSGNTVLHEVNQEGEILKEVFQPDQIKFRLFSARFQLGNISEVSGEGFLFLYPEEYKIYFYDYQMNLKKTFASENFSRFLPQKVKFPNTLSPYDFSPKHSEWWGSALRLAGVYYLGENLFITLLIEYSNLSEKFYLNLHSHEGKTIAKGLVVPFDGIIRYVSRQFVYVVEPSSFDSAGNVIPLKLHRFKLNRKIIK